MKHWKNIVWLLLVSVLTTGCIKEDWDDCDNVTIYFQYLADGDANVLHQYMDKVDLYVFDENGRMQGQRTYTGEQLHNHSAVPSFKLAPGRRYKLVAVGNAYDHTEIANLNATDFGHIYLQSPQWGGTDPVTNHDDNYLGQLEFVVPANEFVVHRDTVTLYSAHIDVEVSVTGLPKAGNWPGAEDLLPLGLRIEQSNAQTNFNNEINQSEKGTIYPRLEYDPETGNYHTTDFALFRMDCDGVLDAGCCEHELVLTDGQGRELVRMDIHDFIQRYADKIDVTRQEALLPIEIHFAPLGIEIKLPAWVIEDIEPDWQ